MSLTGRFAFFFASAVMAADLAPERLEIPEIACTAPDTVPFAFPKIGHDRHAILLVDSAGCSGVLLNGQEPIGRVTGDAAGQHFDFAEPLRAARPPQLGFRPSEAGFGEVRLTLLLTPRLFFYNLRLSRGVLTFTARNTLDNTADLTFRVEAPGLAPAEQTGNLGPNSERDYRFELPALRRGQTIRVVLEKAGEALEGGYRYSDSLRVGR